MGVSILNEEWRRRRGRLEAVAADVDKAGGTALVVVADMGDCRVLIRRFSFPGPTALGGEPPPGAIGQPLKPRVVGGPFKRRVVCEIDRTELRIAESVAFVSKRDGRLFGETDCIRIQPSRSTRTERWLTPSSWSWSR
jgi:hypothetical protein